MESHGIDWSKKHILKINNSTAFCTDEDISSENAIDKRKEIEPWLSAIFQSEHLSLLIGSGLTNAVCFAAGVKPQGMGRLELTHKHRDVIGNHADETAKLMDRGEANIEDDIRAANELITGLNILKDSDFETLKTELDLKLLEFIGNILKSESDFHSKLLNESKKEDHEKALKGFTLLKSFLLSFSSRAASRDRLNIFTTNYDRFIELAADDSGIILLDRFKGKLIPIFRNTRLELDFHYNPPGIRGEPRYVEGVVRITKLHGSIDWRFDNKRIVRSLLPFGADINHPDIPKPVQKDGETKEKKSNSGASDLVVIYPNSSKDIETAFYPYAELFRDFSSSICRPNSVIVSYGYGFSDSHINRTMEDMLTIPSTHIVIIAWDKKDDKNQIVRDRIRKFYDKIGNAAQFTFLLGEHFADLETLVDYYLPKSAIDRITIRKQRIINDRGDENKVKMEQPPEIPNPSNQTEW